MNDAAESIAVSRSRPLRDGLFWFLRNVALYLGLMLFAAFLLLAVLPLGSSEWSLLEYADAGVYLTAGVAPIAAGLATAQTAILLLLPKYQATTRIQGTSMVLATALAVLWIVLVSRGSNVDLASLLLFSAACGLAGWLAIHRSFSSATRAWERWTARSAILLGTALILLAVGFFSFAWIEVWIGA